MFGIDKEELKVEGLCLCVDWSKKKLEAVSASAVNRGMVKGFVLLSQRYLYAYNIRMCMYVLCMQYQAYGTFSKKLNVLRTYPYVVDTFLARSE